VDGDRVVPLPRIVNVYEYLDYITNRVVPDFSLETRGTRRTLVVFIRGRLAEVA
jgi:hypothetical protein